MLNTLEHPGAEVTHWRSTVVLELSTAVGGFLVLPGPYCSRDGLDLCRVGELLGAGERGCVHRGLQLALHEIRVADVDGEATSASSTIMISERERDHLPLARPSVPTRASFVPLDLPRCRGPASNLSEGLMRGMWYPSMQGFNPPNERGRLLHRG